MAKSKKKHSPHEANKLAAAKNRNEFFEKLNEIATICGNSKLISKINQIDRNIIYERRFRRMKIVMDEGVKIKENKWKDILWFFHKYISEIKTEIFPDGPLYNIDDYCYFVLSLDYYNKTINDEYFKEAKEFKETFKPISGYEEGITKVSKSVYHLSSLINIIFSDYTEEVLCANVETIIDPIIKVSKAIFIKVKTYKPERIITDVKNNPRPAFRVCLGISNKGLGNITLKPSDLGIKGSFADFPLDVFIQSHALNRLKERLDNVNPGDLQFGVYDSISKKNYIPYSKRRYLIEYSLWGYKLGYLIVEILEAIVLIRTFLFLTNNSTPEGEKLNKIIGVEKLDKEYLALDRLSTFTDKKFQENEKLKEIFDNAGCSSLYKFTLFNKDENDKSNINPESILKYLEQMKPEQETNDFSLIDEMEEK